MSAESKSRKIIGGEFELCHLPPRNHDDLSVLTHKITGTWTLSGRSALYLVLKELKEEGINHIHLPSYLCESILLVIRSMGFKYDFYPVDMNLCAYPDPPIGSAVLLIHYFGKVNPATEALRAEAGKSFYLIEDASQALLSDWSKNFNNSQYIILSPRKFGPVILGGWCNLPLKNDDANDRVEKVAWQSLAARLIKGQYLKNDSANIEQQTENFYLESLKEVERFLDENPICTYLPAWTKQLIAGYDWGSTSEKRRGNFQLLKKMLSQHVDMLFSEIASKEIPLGFVVRLKKRDWIRMKMAEARIFCPVHWHLPHDVSKQKFPNSHDLSNTVLTIPIDQRYNSTDMEKIAVTLKHLLKHGN